MLLHLAIFSLRANTHLHYFILYRTCMPTHLFPKEKRIAAAMTSALSSFRAICFSPFVNESVCFRAGQDVNKLFQNTFFRHTMGDKLPQLVLALPVLPFLGILKISLMIWTAIACWSDFPCFSISTHHRPLYCLVGVTGLEPIPAAFRQEVQPPQPAPSVSDQMLFYNNVIGF